MRLPLIHCSNQLTIHPSQFSRMRIDNKSMHLNVMRNQWMIDNGFHRFTDGLLRITKTIKPFLEIHPTLTYHVYLILMNPSCLHVLYHLLGTHVASATIAVCHYHDISHTQFKDSH